MIEKPLNESTELFGESNKSIIQINDQSLLRKNCLNDSLLENHYFCKGSIQ